MRLNELVSMRATVAGMTSVAATSVTPSTCIVARIVTASTSISSGVDAGGVRRRSASATSGSNVVNSSGR